MWTSQSEQLTEIRGLRYSILLNAKPATFADALRSWQDESIFRSMFNGLLASASFSAFRWETPPVTLLTATRPFEFVLLDSPGLARRPDPDAFAEHFKGTSETSVVEFPNLGGDAIMIVPCPRTVPSAYGHLAAFVRDAP